MDKKLLKKSFEEGLIDEEKYKQELFLLETKPKSKNKIPQRQYEGLIEEEFEKLFNSYKKQKQKIILILAYYSGLRLSEILNLQKDDFNFETRRLKVRKGKFSKDRDVFIPKYFKKSYLDYIPFKYSKMAVQRMFNKKSMEVKINKIIDTYKLKNGKERNIYKYHFHCLRHSYAVNLLKNGMPLNYVQRLLGHNNISSTSIYTNIDSRSAIEMALEKGL